MATTFTVRTSAGDSNGPTDSGVTTVANPSTGNNTLRINAQTVNHNSAIDPTTAPGTTPGDVDIADSVVYTKVLAMEFVCNLLSLNGNTVTPQVYLKLVGAVGSAYDYVIPLIPGQLAIWLPIPTKDANGNIFTKESNAVVIGGPTLTGDFTIVCTPDKYSDVSISGTIELSN